MRKKLSVQDQNGHPITIYFDSIEAFKYYSDRDSQIILKSGMVIIAKLTYEGLVKMIQDIETAG